MELQLAFHATLQLCHSVTLQLCHFATLQLCNPPTQGIIQQHILIFRTAYESICNGWLRIYRTTDCKDCWLSEAILFLRWLGQSEALAS